MDSVFGLLLLSSFMFIGSFLAGSIPLFIHLSESKLKYVSVLGAGLLVGTALTVNIPEGIKTIYLANSVKHSPLANSISSKISPIITPLPSENAKRHEEEEEDDPFGSVGLVLVLGFIFMLLVDQISRSLTQRDVEAGSQGGKSSGFIATIGLVVHAAADGIALGAAATTTHSDVEMIVFFAIMLHKAPAALGLVTFLLHEGVERRRIRHHLTIFSLSAPLLALITYFGISHESKGSETTEQATAVAMLFSAGTFLYVATVHVLPEVTKDLQGGFSRRELGALVGGALIPLLLTSAHHH